MTRITDSDIEATTACSLQEATIFKLPPQLGMPQNLGSGEQIQFPEAAYSLDPGSQGDFESPVLRVSYTSLTTPASTIDINMKTGKRCEVPLLFERKACF